jgi:hypothetical protein
MPASYNAQKRNSKLVQFDELKDAVIENAVKNVPVLKKEKKPEQNRGLGEFSSPEPQ